MSFKQFLQNSAKEIDLEIETFFYNWNKEIEQISPQLLPLSNALSQACKGGKRIRGALVKLGYQLAKAQDLQDRGNSELIKVSLAYEIFQTAILAHDDIIDKSPTRRGEPALYKKLGGDHYGISQSICLGDIGFFLAFKIISETHFPTDEKNHVLTFLSNAMLDTGIGQVLDVELSGNHKKVNERDVVTIYRFKTAMYTIVAPLSLGAILGGTDDKLLEAIKTYGENVGITYQIQDDIDDTFGNFAALQKEIGADIREGKNTILFVKAIEKANENQKELLEKLYGNPSITGKEIGLIKNIFVETGALDYVKVFAKTHIEQAKKVLPDLTQNPRMKKTLHEITEFFVKKNSYEINNFSAE